MDRTRTSSTDKRKSARISRWQTIVAIVLVVTGWIVAAVFVRLALDWSDSQPYEGQTTEQRYLIIAAIAIGIGLSSTVGAGLWWWTMRRLGRRR